MLFAARSLGVDNNSATIEPLFRYAKEHDYTTHGELFSAQWVVDVIEAHWQGALKARVVHLAEDESPAAIGERMAEKLASGNVVYMVPYDRDKLHYRPVMSRGKAAHWMAATGFMMPTRDEQWQAGIELCWLHPGKFIDAAERGCYDWSQLHVVAFQGNDTRPGLFNFSDLIESNRQLWELNAEDHRQYPGCQIPIGDDPLRCLRGSVVEITRVGC